ncbi:hypothetical protein B0H19DRAFT_1382414 [Mycena capillaripes]|nr:hypothetical protein B0H19DRAFT_1382414 [Mycena capillaripes]
MSSVSQIVTFLKAYFGDALSLVLALFYRGGAGKSDVGDAPSAGDLAADTESALGDGLDKASIGLEPTPKLESTSSEPEFKELTAIELIGAAVAVDLEALPSIFKFPEARSPADLLASTPHKQDFGPPSNLYYEHRLPLGTITNFSAGAQVKGMKLDNLEVKFVKVRKTKGKPEGRGRRSRSKSARPVQGQAPVEVVQPIVQEAPAIPAVAVEPITSAETVPVPVAEPTFAPGSTQWNTNKAAFLAQARGWSAQVTVSHRRSLPIPLPIPVPPPVDVPASQSSKRYSAPPALVASTRASRLNLKDRLSALLLETQDTIAALDEEPIISKNSSIVDIKYDGGMRSKGDDAKVNVDVPLEKDIRGFSAVALEQRQDIFFIGDAEDDEGEQVGTNVRQNNHADVLPTVNSASSHLISSISASQSMVGFANASSRSLSDLLNSFDEAMASPRWRRLLSRSNGFTRRNDSVV